MTICISLACYKLQNIDDCDQDFEGHQIPLYLPAEWPLYSKLRAFVKGESNVQHQVLLSPPFEVCGLHPTRSEN